MTSRFNQELKLKTNTNKIEKTKVNSNLIIKQKEKQKTHKISPYQVSFK